MSGTKVETAKELYKVERRIEKVKAILAELEKERARIMEKLT